VFGVKKSKKKEEIEIENIYNCTMCRECLRPDKFNKSLELGKERKKYIFTIESVGVVRPEKLFLDALQIIKSKVEHYLKHLQSLKKGNN
jgi:DNA-directed RNA polymerase alpha subunit